MKTLCLILAATASLGFCQDNDKKSRQREKITPTHADVGYGPHDRNRLDVWIPEKSSDGFPFPVLIYFHGGGFVAGDKSAFDPEPYLENGIACVSVNYRFVDGKDTLALAPLNDGARAVQTVRHHAKEWNIDPGRVALSGGSAGAVISMWIAYQDDLAILDSEDPVAQESTRVTCIVPINGPTNLLPDWIRQNLGGPREIHGSYVKMFGEPVSENMADSTISLIEEVSPWEHVTADDPPSLLIYGGPLDEVPLPETVTSGKLIHHPYFGKALKEKLDQLGVESEFRHGSSNRSGTTIPQYLMMQFAMID